ncbi:MAG: sigma-70 family RNA polymerase sigma factor [Bacteroidetes bacterium]|nr:sigma-70 family RNA polymerase sigma factor [Bacteroidota bacterium]
MGNYTSYNDSELIEKAKCGEDAAFEELVGRYEQQVANTVKGMLGDNAAAEDVGQETFIRFYRSLEKFRGDSALGTYITRIAINLSLNEIKKQKKVISLFHRKNVDDVKEIDLPDQRNRESESESKDLVDKALQNLKPEFRMVVVLRMLQGYSTKEAASILNVPIGTVLSRLARAQKNLRRILKPFI